MIKLERYQLLVEFDQHLHQTPTKIIYILHINLFYGLCQLSDLFGKYAKKKEERKKLLRLKRGYAFVHSLKRELLRVKLGQKEKNFDEVVKFIIILIFVLHNASPIAYRGRKRGNYKNN